MGALSTTKRWLVLLIAVGVGLSAGAVLLTADGSSDIGSPTSAHLTEPVVFYANAGEKDDAILSLGGLTVSGSCRDYGPRTDGPYLSMTARTAVDDAMIGVSFVQRKGGEQSAYSFGLSDFDRDYGRWDFLGTNPDNTVGTLVYSHPDRGQVTLTYLADRATAQGDCAFSGTATYAPAVDSEPAAPSSAEARDELGVTYSYLGVTCPTPNSIACDEVGLYVSTRQAPRRLIATVAGHAFELEREPQAGRHGGSASYEGFLRAPGLLHRGALAVEASADDRWVGDPPVEALIELQSVFEDGVAGPHTEIELPLSAGYG